MIRNYINFIGITILSVFCINHLMGLVSLERYVNNLYLEEGIRPKYIQLEVYYNPALWEDNRLIPEVYAYNSNYITLQKEDTYSKDIFKSKSHAQLLLKWDNTLYRDIIEFSVYRLSTDFIDESIKMPKKDIYASGRLVAKLPASANEYFIYLYNLEPLQSDNPTETIYYWIEGTYKDGSKVRSTIIYF